jgi:predicted nuclease of predicted toxin-antitoxin system
VNPLDFPLLADENIQPQVVEALRTLGRDVVSCREIGLVSVPDDAILRYAHDHGRVVLTHDSDFGQLALAAGEPYVGLIHVRPGHIAVAVTIGTLAALHGATLNVAAPFVVVAERRGDRVRIRLRRPAL